MSDIQSLLAKGQTAAQIVKTVGVDGVLMAVPTLSRANDMCLACHELLESAWREVSGSRTGTFTPTRKCELLSMWVDVLKTMDEEEVYASKLALMMEIFCEAKDFEAAAKAYFRFPHPRSDFLPSTLREEDYDAFGTAVERVGVAMGVSATHDIAHIMLHRLLQQNPDLKGVKTHMEMILGVYERSARRGEMAAPQAVSHRPTVSSMVPVVCVPSPHVLVNGKLKGSEPIRSVAANHTTAFAGSMDGSVKIIDIESGKVTGQHRDYKSGVSCVRIMEETRMVTSSYDNNVRVFDAKSPSKTLFTLSGHTDLVRCIAVNPENLNVVASCSIDETVRVWDVRQAAKPVSVLQHEDAIISLAWSGQFLLSGSADGSLFAWEADLMTKKLNLGNGVLDIHALADGAHNGAVMCGCQNGAVFSVNTSRETATAVLPFHVEDVTVVLTSPHAPGMTITGSSDDCIRICFNDRCAVVVAGHSLGVSSLALAADDGTRTVFVSGGGDGDVRVWGYDIVKEYS